MKTFVESGKGSAKKKFGEQYGLTYYLGFAGLLIFRLYDIIHL